MKVFIIGHKGWIGKMYLELFEKDNIEYCYSNHRGESNEILNEIMNSNCTHVLCVMGRTHGELNGTYFNTIDYLQHNETLQQNVNDNLFVPLRLAMFLQNTNIHFTYMGTGCIYNYDDEHTTNNMVGFNDEDTPNFFGSNYSIVKGFTNELMKYTNALVLRIRMPITSKNDPRNFITKITKYEKICSIPNSMSVLDELLPVSIRMMNQNKSGLYNFTNPGSISHNEILTFYKKYVDPEFTWQNFTLEDQDMVLKSKRSNNYLTTEKLRNEYHINDIRLAVIIALQNYNKE
jgi:nucleoside-diphosphate-sugar epimerase